MSSWQSPSPVRYGARLVIILNILNLILFQSEREIRARTFQFDLGEPGSDSGAGVQFPANADPVLNVIFKLRGLSPAQEAGAQPPPEEGGLQAAEAASPAASIAASNSDSGIGYRDEALLHQVGDLIHREVHLTKDTT